MKIVLEQEEIEEVLIRMVKERMDYKFDIESIFFIMDDEGLVSVEFGLKN